MADFEEVVNTRRSIREYDSKEVEDEKIEKILSEQLQEKSESNEKKRNTEDVWRTSLYTAAV